MNTSIQKKKYASFHHHLMLWLMVLVLWSCEGYRCVKGMVIDAETLVPLENVKCDVQSAEYSAYTDSTGTFDVCNRMEGCVPECQPIVIWFSKEGYVPFLGVNESAEGNIALKKDD